MQEYDLLLKSIENILEENIKCEDGELYLSHKIKYSLYELVKGIDSKFIKKLHKELEYKDVQ
jgi:hypothetical protein